MKRIISISLSPNAQKDDVLLALKTMVTPWKWNDDKSSILLKNNLNKYFDGGHETIFFSSGRSALYFGLKSLGIGSGDEVIVQSFTCVAVPNAIVWCNAKPVYCDTGNDFNIDIDMIEKLINKKTKAIIVQHAFGIPADIERISNIASKNNIYLIEDCAVSLGSSVGGKKIGTFGDFSVLSFGRDKIISSVFGGAVVTKNKTIINKLIKYQASLQNPKYLFTFQQIFHPIAFFFILPLYGIGYKKYTLGKFLLYILQRLKLLGKPVTKSEENGSKADFINYKFATPQAALANNQFNKLSKYNIHRVKIADYYYKHLNNLSGIGLPLKKDGAVWLRFPVIVEKDSNKMKLFLKCNNVIVGDWYKTPIYPVRRLSRFYYKNGTSPESERICRKIINLPTHPNISIKDAGRICNLIKKWLTN
jgi:perosamine synthetase